MFGSPKAFIRSINEARWASARNVLDKYPQKMEVVAPSSRSDWSFVLVRTPSGYIRQTLYRQQVVGSSSDRM